MTLPELTNRPRIVKAAMIIGILVLGAIVYIVASLSPDPSPPLISLPQEHTSPSPVPPRSTMYIRTESTDVPTGSRFDIEVVADAHNTIINGIDSIVLYDPSLIRVVEISAPEETGGFNLVRKQVEGNKIILTTIKTQATDTPTGEIIVARITVQALKPGTAPIALEHIPGTTRGSTIIKADQSENILDQVTHATITVR